MSWVSPIPLLWVAYVAAAAGGLTVVAYLLKMRRRRFEVPFSTLWQRVLQQKDASSLWKQLRRLLSLFLLLLILGLVLVAALGPELGRADPRARSVVVVIDASASMKAADGDDDGRTRMAVARQQARDLVATMGGGDVAMIMKVDGQATPLSRFDGDAAMLGKVIDGIEASDTPADLRRALGAAADALRDRKNALIVLISDGAFPEPELAGVRWDAAAAPAAPAPAAPPPAGAPAAEAAAPDAAAPADDGAARRASFADKSLADVDLAGIDVRFIPVGRRADNVGIVAFNVRRYVANKAAYEVYIEVQNFGTEPARRQLALYSGDDAIDLRDLELAPGAKLRRIYPDLSGGTDHRLRASLRPAEGPGGSDPFPLDDQAFALLPARKKQKVLLVTKDNLFLEGAILVYDNVEAAKLSPEEYERAFAAPSRELDVESFDAVVFDDYTPAQVPARGNLLYFNPDGEHSPVPIARVLPRPRVTEIAEDHPVMRWVTLSDVNFLDSKVFAPSTARGETWLALSVRDPIAVARRDGGRKIVAFGFSLGGTDLTMRVAFPLVLVNVLDWFAGDDADLLTTYVTGQRFRVPLDGVVGAREAEVIAPDGDKGRAPVVDGVATFYGAQVGFHTVRVADPAGVELASIELAANLANPVESDIAPASELSLGGRALAAPEAFAVSHRRALWLYLVLAALALLMIEWFTYHRRVTV